MVTKTIAYIGLGLVRGREPEINLLAKMGYKIKVIAYQKKMAESPIKPSENVEIIYPDLKAFFGFDPIHLFRKEYDCTSWVQFKNLEEYLSDVDLVLTHEVWNCFSYGVVKSAKKLKKPVAVVVFETIPKNFIFTYGFPYFFNTRYIIKNADLFIAQTHKTKNYLKSLGVNKKKIKILYPGISLKSFSPSKNIPKEKLSILFVGNFIQKGLKETLIAFKKLVKEFPNKSLTLKIVGSGPESLINKIKKLQKKYSIKYFGKVPYNRMAIIYRESDIYCMASRDTYRFLGLIKTSEEQFGYSLVEAMASGLPIITTNCGAIPEIANPGNIIVNQNAPEEIFKALKIFVINKSRRIQVGKHNRRRTLKLFDSGKQSKKFKKILDTLIK